MNFPPTKICPRCNTTKSLSEYCKSNATKDGLSCYCKACKKGLKDKTIPLVGRYKNTTPTSSVFSFSSPKWVLNKTKKIVRWTTRNANIPIQEIEDICSMSFIAICSTEYNPDKSSPNTFLYIVVRGIYWRWLRDRKALKARSEMLSNDIYIFEGYSEDKEIL